jgi:hypothetical protein
MCSMRVPFVINVTRFTRGSSSRIVRNFAISGCSVGSPPMMPTERTYAPDIAKSSARRNVASSIRPASDST